MAVHEELLTEIYRSAETDAGAEPAEGQQTDDVTFDHTMASQRNLIGTLPLTTFLTKISLSAEEIGGTRLS